MFLMQKSHISYILKSVEIEKKNGSKNLKNTWQKHIFDQAEICFYRCLWFLLILPPSHHICVSFMIWDTESSHTLLNLGFF